MQKKSRSCLKAGFQMHFTKICREICSQMKRNSLQVSPSSPPLLQLEGSSKDEKEKALNHNIDEKHLECKEEMPVFSPKAEDHNVASNIKRRRILPPMFLSPPAPLLPEDDAAYETEAFSSERETLCRMQMAASILLGDLEDREAERLRETRDYYEGDTPHTSQESAFSDYNWSNRQGGDIVPLDEIMDFIWKYLARSKIYSRVSVFMRLTDEIYLRDTDHVKGHVASLMNCEPVVLLNTLEDAIDAAQKAMDEDSESESAAESGAEAELESLEDSA
jgi:hypothetical protein